MIENESKAQLEKLEKELLEGKNEAVTEAYKRVQAVKNALMADGQKTMALFAVSSGLKDTLDMASKAERTVGAQDIFYMMLAAMVRLEQEDMIKFTFETDGKPTKQD